MLTHLRVRNYKSLKAVDLDVGRFHMLVGSNGSGKSNFVDCLDFLRSVFTHGLSTAVSAFGGYENISFRRARRSKGGIAFEITLLVNTDQFGILRENMTTGHVQYAYQFEIRARGQAISSDYVVQFEKMTVSHFANQPEKPASHVLTISRSTTPSVRFSTKELEAVFPKNVDWVARQGSWVKESLSDSPKDELYCSPGQPVAYMAIVRPFFSFMESIRVFQINHSDARLPASPSPRAELGRHGNNLPAALSWLKRNHSDAFENVLAQLRGAVPTMKGVEIDYTDTKQLGLFFNEDRVGRRWFATDVSDGTIQTVALYIPLYDPRPDLVVVEEPENSVHPWVLRNFVDTARELSSDRQILLTTHSPIAVSRVAFNELFLVERVNGETVIKPAHETYPDGQEIVSDGLMTLGEYWDSGQMRAVPDQRTLWDEDDK